MEMEWILLVTISLSALVTILTVDWSYRAYYDSKVKRLQETVRQLNQEVTKHKMGHSKSQLLGYANTTRNPNAV